MSTFIDIHVIQNLPPSNVNRDDTGAPKSGIFGGTRRARVSSQAWKRATRDQFNAHFDPERIGERTKRIVWRIAQNIMDIDGSIDADAAVEMAVEVVLKNNIKPTGADNAKNRKAARDKLKPHERYPTRSLILVSRTQLRGLAELAIELNGGADITRREVQRVLEENHSFDLALFGRMIAEEPRSNIDACCQVAHALSVHGVTNEFDYYTALDDNADDDVPGASMIGATEFNSSTLYRYANINAGRLAETLGDVEGAAEAVRAFITAFVTSMPSGKQNSFANRTLPEAVVVRIRGDQPVSLASAFVEGVDDVGHRTAATAIALGNHARSLDTVYAPAIGGGFLAAGNVADSPEALEALSVFGHNDTLSNIVELAAEATLAVPVAQNGTAANHDADVDAADTEEEEEED